MCGVLGILGKHNLMLSRELLLLLAHRGQDASGLLWLEDGQFRTQKAMGSPSGICVEDSSTEVLLGSTRYPTSGRRVVDEQDLKTFVGPFWKGKLALTHNGNITNMPELSEKRYDCDTQLLTDLLSRYLSDTNGNLTESFKKLDSDVDGAYSLVGIYKGKMFAYRDPRGFKPLVYGRKNGFVIVASESTVMDMVGVPQERDVYPGELLVFDKDGSMSSHSISQNAIHSHCFFEFVYFAFPSARIENHLVYDVRFRLGRALGREFKRRKLPLPDYVVPVPDTSRPAAQALAESLDVPMREIILKNRYLGRTFIARSQKERNRLAKNKYLYLDDKIRGKSILVVDDSIVRGTTAKMIVSDLRERGAKSVYFAATCPPQTHPCYYGIDIATDKELIASDTDVEGIAQYIGADALIYQEMDGLVNAIELKDLCLACIDGNYPTDHARRIRQYVKDHEVRTSGRDYERSM